MNQFAFLGKRILWIPVFRFRCLMLAGTLGVFGVGNLTTAYAAPADLAAANAPQRPNIVLILADDLGYGDLGCYGHPKFRTPRIDRLATEGTRLTEFNTPAPFCALTRASLLTGRYPSRCGLTSNPTPDAMPAADSLHLPESEVLLPQILAKAGYATSMIGKWHLGHREPNWRPRQRGFEEYLGILYSNDMRPVRLIEQDRVVEYPVVQATLTRRYTERAMEFIEQKRQQPFFLYLAHAMPHKPLACSEAFYQKSGAGLYGDVMAELDWSVGQILDKLDALNLAHNTLVIFTSDNGAYYGGSAGTLRGMKGTSWEGGYRVPCVLRWPARLPAGKNNDRLCVMMDLFSTIVAATGSTPPSDRTIDGRDLRPLLAGEADSAHEVVFGINRGQLATIRDQRWKLHVLPQASPPAPKPGSDAPDKRAPDGVTLLAPYEQAPREVYPGLRTGDETIAGALFDLEQDPTEQHNVGAEHPDEVARLRSLFEKMQSEVAATRAESRSPATPN